MVENIIVLIFSLFSFKGIVQFYANLCQSKNNLSKIVF